MDDRDYVALDVCFFCGEAMGVVLHRQLRRVLPRKAVFTHDPCATCKGHMERGVILISVRDGESGDNPYRTGGWVVVTENAIRKVVSEPMQTTLLTKRAGFIENTTWEAIGLSMEGVER